MEIREPFVECLSHNNHDQETCRMLFEGNRRNCKGILTESIEVFRLSRGNLPFFVIFTNAEQLNGKGFLASKEFRCLFH